MSRGGARCEKTSPPPLSLPASCTHEEYVREGCSVNFSVFKKSKDSNINQVLLLQHFFDCTYSVTKVLQFNSNSYANDNPQQLITQGHGFDFSYFISYQICVHSIKNIHFK